MRCPYCRFADSRVVDSREADDGQLIRRRRSCPECGKRFTTVEEAVLAIVKRNGVTEPFSRTKIMSGVRKACQGRPVDEDSIALLAQKVEEAVLAIVKRNGVTEPFSRTKVMSGVRKACQGRPVDEDSIALLAQKVEETVRAKGAAELPSHEVGLAILTPLRELDQVAYIRFASVYKSFDSLDAFEKEIASLRDTARD